MRFEGMRGSGAVLFDGELYNPLRNHKWRGKFKEKQKQKMMLLICSGDGGHSVWEENKPNHSESERKAIENLLFLVSATQQFSLMDDLDLD